VYKCSKCEILHDNRHTYCKSCYSAYQAEYRKNNLDEIKRKQKEYRQRNAAKLAERSRLHRLKKKQEAVKAG
jgi:hypothetical protein